MDLFARSVQSDIALSTTICNLKITGSLASGETKRTLSLLSGWRSVSQKLRSSERVLDGTYGGHVAVVFTDSRVLGFSALTNRWTEEKLRVGEVMVSIEAKGNVGAVITNLRAFGLSAKTGRWVVERLGLEK